LDSIFINNLLNVNQTYNTLAIVINDSIIQSLTEKPFFEDTLNNVKYTINKPFSINGKPTDTLITTITYLINDRDTTICNEKYIKQL